jgi:hypothetical protein
MKKTIETIYYGKLGDIIYVLTETAYPLQKTGNVHRVERGYSSKKGEPWRPMGEVEREFSKVLDSTKVVSVNQDQATYYEAVILFLEAENAWYISRDRARYRQEMADKGITAPSFSIASALEDEI